MYINSEKVLKAEHDTLKKMLDGESAGAYSSGAINGVLCMTDILLEEENPNGRTDSD